MFQHPAFRKLHRCSGLLLAAFGVVHLLNHVLLAVDHAAAFAFMDAFRHVYRQGAVEPVILVAVLVQIATGPALARGAGSPMAARISGYYLLFFLLVHVSAVLWGRLGLGLDTDIGFAAAGMRGGPGIAFFAPYYFLAVVAVCLHVGLGLSRLFGTPSHAALLASTATGLIGGAAIVGGLLAVAGGTLAP